MIISVNLALRVAKKLLPSAERIPDPTVRAVKWLTSTRLG